MERISGPKLFQAPVPARTPAEALDKGLQLMATVEEFTAGEEISVGKFQRVAFEQVNEGDHAARLYRYTELAPSTGLTSAASAAAGAIGAMLAHVAPGWAQKCKDWGQDASLSVVSVEYGRSVRDNKGEVFAEGVLLRPLQEAEYLVRDGDGGVFKKGFPLFPDHT